MPKQTKRNIDIATNMVALTGAILILVLNASGVNFEPNRTAKATGTSTVTSGDATNITSASADLAGNVSNSTIAITARGFEYGTDTSYGSTVNDTSAKSPYNYLYQFSTLGAGLSGPNDSEIGSNNLIYSVGSGFGDSVLSINNQDGTLVRSQNQLNSEALGGLYGIASDSSGNMYVAAYSNQKIFKVAPNGDYISDFPTGGYPLGISIDNSDNVYVSILGGGINKYDTAGNLQSNITPPAQTRALTNDSNNNLYASSDANVIYKYSSSAVLTQTIGASGSGPEDLSGPAGLGVSSDGKIYVADVGNIRTQIYNADGSYNSTIPGASASASLDSTDYLYISDANYPTFSGIKKYSPVPTYTNGDFSLSLSDLNCGTTYHYRAFANNGDGSADYGEDKTFTTGACMNIATNPAGGAETTSVDLSGNISFSASTLTGRGFQWGSTTEYGNQLADPTENPQIGNFILNLTGLTCNSTYHYRAYGTNSSATYYGGDQSFTTAPCPTMSVYTDGVSNTTTGSADLIGSIINSNTSITQRGFQWGVTSEYGNTLADESQNIPTSSILRFGSLGSDPGQFNSPQGIRTDNDGNVYVVDSINNRVQKFNSSGAYITQIGEFGGGDGQFWNPQDVLVDSSNNIYVSDSNNNRIQKFNSFGIYQSTIASTSPTGLAFNLTGNIIATDLNNSRVVIYNADTGAEINSFGSAGSGDGEFNAPRGVAVDTDDNIYIADTFNDRVQKFNGSGAYQSQVGGSGDGNGQFNRPYYIAIDTTNKLYVTDIYNNRVQIFDNSLAYISKFGQYGSGAGDFSQPTGIAISNSGNIYVSEDTNNRVQEFSTVASFGQGSYSLNLNGLSCQTYHFRAYGANASGTFYGEDATFDPCMTIRTNPASGVSNFGAELNGSVINSSSTISSRGFQLGTSTEYGTNLPDNSPLYKYQNNLTINSAGGSTPDTLSAPSWTVAAPNGDIYVVDQGHNRILQYNNSGAFVASYGESGGDLGQFNSPNSLAFDSYGNIYVTDGGNARVQKFNSNFADPVLIDSSSCPGGSFTDPIGISIDSSNNVYVTDTSSARVIIIASDLSCRSITSPGLFAPVGVAVNSSGFIGVTDPGSSSVQFFDIDGNLLGALPADNIPVGIAFDNSGFIYISRLLGNDVLKVNSADGSIVDTISISTPLGISLDASQNVLVASTGSSTAQRFANTPYYDTGDYTIAAGSLSCGTTYHYRAYATNVTDTYYGEDRSFTTESCMNITTNGAQNITDSSAQLYGDIIYSLSALIGRGFQIGTTTAYGQTINDTPNYNPTGKTAVFNRVIGEEELSEPTGVVIGPNGNIYVTDSNHNQVKIYSPSGTLLSQFGERGTGDGQLKYPWGVAVDTQGYIYVVDYNNNRVQKFNPDGTYNSQFGTEGTENGQFDHPQGIALDGSGQIYVTDTGNHRVQKFNQDGTYNSQFGEYGTGDGQFLDPDGIAIANDGSIYVSDYGAERVQKFGSDFAYQEDIGASGGDYGQYRAPEGIAIDSSNRIYVVDSFSNKVIIYNNDGSVLTQFGDYGSAEGYFDYPWGVAVNNTDNIYIADSYNNRIQEFNLVNNFETGEYNLQASSLLPCTTYHFRAFGTNQNGTYYGDDNTFETTGCNPAPPTPPPTPTPSGGSTAPSGTSFSGGSAPIITSESALTNSESGSAGQNTQPAKAKGFFGGLLINLENLAKRVPRQVAVAIPYLLIFLLLLLSLLYYALSYAEYRNSKKYRELITRYNNLLNGGQNFIALTSHYLNSPISMMQVATGLLLSEGILGKLKGESIMKALNKINKTTDELLTHNSQSTSKILQGIDSEPKEITTGRYLFSPLVWIPTLIATILLITANILFLRADVFALNLYSISTQLLLFLVGIILILMSWRSFRRNQLLEQKRQKALKKEKALANAKAEFIKKASGSMQKELKIIQQASSDLKNEKKSKELLLGLESLLSIQASLGLLESFNDYNPTGKLGTKDFKKAIDTAIKDNVDQINKKNLSVHTHLKGGISATLDNVALTALVSSTIDNAVKFSHEGGHIDIYAQMSHGKTILEVKDDGVGIPKDKLDGIMTPFYRASSAMKFDYEGLGLGLYMDRIIIDQIGGQIQIKSLPSKGTRIIMGIPN